MRQERLAVSMDENDEQARARNDNSFSPSNQEQSPQGSPGTPITTTTTTIPLPTQYENRLVAFIDILAWRDKIKKSEKDETLIPKLCMALLKSKFSSERSARLGKSSTKDTRDPERSAHGDVQFAQFSDSLVISTSANNIGVVQLLFEILEINRFLFFHNELLIRGGIAFGPMFHQGSIAFGPALTAAYDLEREHAVYPRIILDRSLEQTFFGLQKTVDLDSKPGPTFKWIRRSSDGFYFLDFLQPLTAMSGQQFHPEIIRGIVVPEFATARKLIIEGLQTHRYVTRIWDKYRWLAEYFNGVIGEYPEAAIEPISMDFE
jgi:hypothetical protein